MNPNESGDRHHTISRSKFHLTSNVSLYNYEFIVTELHSGTVHCLLYTYTNCILIASFDWLVKSELISNNMLPPPFCTECLQAIRFPFTMHFSVLKDSQLSLNATVSFFLSVCRFRLNF